MTGSHLELVVTLHIVSLKDHPDFLTSASNRAFYGRLMQLHFVISFLPKNEMPDSVLPCAYVSLSCTCYACIPVSSCAFSVGTPHVSEIRPDSCAARTK